MEDHSNLWSRPQAFGKAVSTRLSARRYWFMPFCRARINLVAKADRLSKRPSLRHSRRASGFLSKEEVWEGFRRCRPTFSEAFVHFCFLPRGVPQHPRTIDPISSFASAAGSAARRRSIGRHPGEMRPAFGLLARPRFGSRRRSAAEESRRSAMSYSLGEASTFDRLFQWASTPCWSLDLLKADKHRASSRTRASPPMRVRSRRKRQIDGAPWRQIHISSRLHPAP